MLQIATGNIDGNKMPTYALFTIDQRFNYWFNGDYLMHSHNITEVDHDLIEFEDLIREILSWRNIRNLLPAKRYKQYSNKFIKYLMINSKI